jgi:glycerophosphoryl diester phosphodiesterase
VKCCTSDLTLAEFKTLKGKMDAANNKATNVDDYMDATANWRTDLYSAGSHGVLMTHAESIQLIKEWGRKATPELKKYDRQAGMPSYDEIRAKVAQEYKDAGFDPKNVWLQSFEIADIEYWVNKTKEFGVQAVYLDNAYCDGSYGDQDGTQNTRGCRGVFNDELASAGDERSPMQTADHVNGFEALKAKGINFIAPPMQMLVKKDGKGYWRSEYATAAKAAGLKIITWTLERSGPLGGGGGWYYGTINSNVDNDGDMLELLHVLHKSVGIEGIFSDWPATTTFYANCLDVVANGTVLVENPVEDTASASIPSTLLASSLTVLVVLASFI